MVFWRAVKAPKTTPNVMNKICFLFDKSYHNSCQSIGSAGWLWKVAAPPQMFLQKMAPFTGATKRLHLGLILKEQCCDKQTALQNTIFSSFCC